MHSERVLDVTIHNDRHDASARVEPVDHIDGRIALLAVLFWLLFGAMVTINLLISTDPEYVSVSGNLTYAFGAASLWMILTAPLVRLVHVIRTKWQFGGAVLALAALGILAAVAVSLAVSGVSLYLSRRFQDDGFRVLTFNLMLQYRLPLDFMAAFVVVMAGVARSYLHNLRLRQREAAALRARLVESRLATLRSQLNPHFLFNTLNAVGAVAQHDPPRVRRILAELSEFLRYMLDDSGDEEISLRAEFDILRKYFEILELRYEDWLETGISSDPEIGQALVPSLILQPLAENALKHGVGPAGGIGWIRAAAVHEGESLVLTMSDSGPGNVPPVPDHPDQPRRASGFGLRHTRERLEGLYGSEFSFQLRRTAEGGTVAEIRIPYHTVPTLTTPRDPDHLSEHEEFR